MRKFLVFTLVHLFSSSVFSQDFVQGYASSAWNLQNKTVVHVTNLNDSGPGSFREAVSESNRIVLFDVGGIIDISDAIDITGDNLVIAAFTAPGQFGVVLRGRRGIRIRSDNVALIGMKVWIDSFSREVDGIQARGNNNLIAYGSTMFATDECLSTFGESSENSIEAENITFYRMIAVGANNDVHASGGMMNSKGVTNVDFIQCVAAFNQERSFRFGAGTEGFTQFGNQYNTVIYNWLNSAVMLRGPAHVNIIGNFFKRGPSNTFKDGIASENGLMYIADNNNNMVTPPARGSVIVDEPWPTPYTYSFLTAEESY